MDLPADRFEHRGCFSIPQARAVGWTESAIATARRRGEWIDIRHGVYLPRDEHELLDPRGEHLALIAADQLVLGTRWHAARRSAAVLFDLPLIGEPPVIAQLLADRGDRRTRPGSRHQRIGRLPEEHRGRAEGITVVSPTWVVCEIARDEDFRNGVVIADVALRRGVSRQELLQCLERMSRWSGVARAREVMTFADALSESPLESLSRCGCHALGLPPPELQVAVWCGGELVGRVDKLWREANTIGEDDGFAKYGGTDGEREAAWRAQKRRTERLEDLGFEVVHWGWEEAWRPAGVLDSRLRRAFERGRRQTVDPRVRLVPTEPPATAQRWVA
jgi:hypothetical protein